MREREPAHGQRQRPVDVLVALHAERNAEAPQRVPPLRRRERIRLGLEEGDVRAVALADRAAAGQVDVPLRVPGKGDARRAQG